MFVAEMDDVKGCEVVLGSDKEAKVGFIYSNLGSGFLIFVCQNVLY